MVLGWIIMYVFLVSLSDSGRTLNNQTREYTNIQILKKRFFNVSPVYSNGRLNDRREMQEVCKVYSNA